MNVAYRRNMKYSGWFGVAINRKSAVPANNEGKKSPQGLPVSAL
jgi:hypothetical protein